MIHFNINNLIKSDTGRIIISIILGIGLATLFNTACKNKNCITFNGPVLNEVDGKIYEFADLCYKYEMKATHCDSNKQIVDVKPNEVVGVAF